MGGGFKPQIILLKEGTDTSQGKAQLISNINACAAVADIVRTTLGPRGMDKLMHKDGKVTVSNDGATIMKTLEIVHPAAQCLVDIAKSQDSEVGLLPNFLRAPTCRPTSWKSRTRLCGVPSPAGEDRARRRKGQAPPFSPFS